MEKKREINRFECTHKKKSKLISIIFLDSEFKKYTGKFLVNTRNIDLACLIFTQL